MLHEKGLKLDDFEVSNSHKIGKFESFVYFVKKKKKIECTVPGSS